MLVKNTSNGHFENAQLSCPGYTYRDKIDMIANISNSPDKVKIVRT
jgi:hypothetical protein